MPAPESTHRGVNPQHWWSIKVETLKEEKEKHLRGASTNEIAWGCSRHQQIAQGYQMHTHLLGCMGKPASSMLFELMTRELNMSACTAHSSKLCLDGTELMAGKPSWQKLMSLEASR